MNFLISVGGQATNYHCHCEGEARGNPFSFRPLWGRAVLCTAGDADCHAALRLAMTAEDETRCEKRPRPKTGPLCDPAWAKQAEVLSNRLGDAVQLIR